MKRLLLLFCFTGLLGFQGHSQAMFHSDTFTWSISPTTMGRYASGYLKIVNVGKFPIQDSVFSNFMTRFDHTIRSAGGYKYVNLGVGDSDFISVNLGIPPAYTLQYPTFRPDTINIVVVWPTGNGATTTDSMTLSFHLKSFTAIEALDNSLSHIRFFPNPATGSIVSVEGLPDGQLIRNMMLFDAAGRMQTGFKLENNTINVKGLPFGEYFVQIQLTDGSVGKYKLVRTPAQ